MKIKTIASLTSVLLMSCVMGIASATPLADYFSGIDTQSANEGLFLSALNSLVTSAGSDATLTSDLAAAAAALTGWANDAAILANDQHNPGTDASTACEPLIGAGLAACVYLETTISPHDMIFVTSRDLCLTCDYAQLNAFLVGQGSDIRLVPVFESSGTTVPEPATLSLLALGLAGVGFMRRRKAA